MTLSDNPVVNTGVKIYNYVMDAIFKNFLNFDFSASGQQSYTQQAPTNDKPFVATMGKVIDDESSDQLLEAANQFTKTFTNMAKDLKAASEKKDAEQNKKINTNYATLTVR